MSATKPRKSAPSQPLSHQAEPIKGRQTKAAQSVARTAAQEVRLIGGQWKRSKLPVPDLESNAGELFQLYVRASFHGLRLGSRLLATALAWLESRGFDPLYVGVWSRNEGAQRLYGRFGFTRHSEYEFPVGTQRDHEYILRRA